jgi:hypothetical protein
VKNQHDIQHDALRDPLEIVSASFLNAGVNAESLKFKADKSFIELIGKLGLTLFVSREYENLLVSLRNVNGKLEQTAFPMAHPSGILADRKKNCLYVLSSRNPNLICEFLTAKTALARIENDSPIQTKGILFPSRVKYYPGAYYLHDLAFIGNSMYANAVGMNGIIRVNMNNPEPEKISWWPKCMERKGGVPGIEGNYIQLNSIAGGKNLAASFFSSSGEEKLSVRPGHLDYPVDKKGVIFSGKTRQVIARGLTRPHSARLYKNRIWVDNSGYGEFGFIKDGSFIPLVKLPGWTRGLLIHKDIAFVGTSKVLERFSHYAPGIKDKEQACGIFAVSLKTGKVIGSVTWPYGNQIFGIDFLNSNKNIGFAYNKAESSLQAHKDQFYKYK